MKMLRALVLAAALSAAPAFAQWQTPNHSVPIGRGGGVTGFGNAAPGTAGLPLTSNGATSDPSFQVVPNAGLANMPANTIKCNPTGSSAAVQDCTGSQVASILGAGIDQNILNAQSANYSIVAGDAGKVIYVTGGPFTVTLPAVTGFATNAVVSVCNGNPNASGQHAVLLSGFPNPLFVRLYMQQCTTVAIENGAWAAKVVPGRFHPTFTPTWLVDNGGNDNNDGFVSNAPANALQTMAACFRIAQVEFDLSGNIQPICSPTAGQTLVGSWTIVGPLVGASVINVTGNGGVATLQPTPGTGGYVLQLSDFAPYMISTNITWDCTGGTAGCVDISFHQQTGADINAGTTLKGNAVGHIGLSCDSKCKINIGANPLTVTGAFSSVVTLDQDSIANFNSGVTISASANITGSLITASHGSSLFFFGALTAGAGISIAEIFTVRNNSTVCVQSNFTTSGSFGTARQWSALNNGLFGNISAVAIPGSTPGISTSANWAAGVVVNSGLNSAGC